MYSIQDRVFIVTSSINRWYEFLFRFYFFSYVHKYIHNRTNIFIERNTGIHFAWLWILHSIIRSIVTVTRYNGTVQIISNKTSVTEGRPIQTHWPANNDPRPFHSLLNSPAIAIFTNPSIYEAILHRFKQYLRFTTSLAIVPTYSKSRTGFPWRYCQRTWRKSFIFRSSRLESLYRTSNRWTWTKTRLSIKTVTRSASAYFFICPRAVY